MYRENAPAAKGSPGGPPKILIVDDEPDFLELFRIWLEEDGYEVHEAQNGWEALNLFVEHRPGLTITDLRMPAMDGLQLIGRIRELSGAHVLALTAVGDTESIVRGLEVGADEYLVKPVVKREFLARVRSLVRRATPPDVSPIRYDDQVVALDILAHTARFRGVELHLRPTEFRLLAYLALHNDRVIGHEELLDSVWGDHTGSMDSLKWHVSSLREKLETDPRHPKILVTFPKVGYRYICP